MDSQIACDRVGDTREVVELFSYGVQNTIVTIE